MLEEYMLLRQMVTPLVFVYWRASRVYSAKYLSTLFVLVFCAVLILSFPQQMKIAYLWVTYCLVLYGYGLRITGDHVFAACYAVLAAHFGGWLYEIPFWHQSTMFYSPRYPWLINMQILSGVFCAWLVVKKHVKVNKVMLVAAMYYGAVSLFWLTRATHSVYWPLRLWWLPRTGAMFLLWTIIMGIRDKEVKV